MARLSKRKAMAESTDLHVPHHRLHRKDLGTPSQRRDAVAEQLQKIYENTDGSMPDMQMFEKTKRRPWVRWVGGLSSIIALFILSAPFWPWFMGLANHANVPAVDLTIAGPEHVAPLDKVTYQVTYHNATIQPLAQAALEVHYPPEFIVETTSLGSDNTQHSAWTLGAVTAGAAKTISITGHWQGNLGTATRLQAVLTYTPANFNSAFQTVATLATTIDASPADITVNGPDTVPLGSPVAYDITITPHAAPVDGMRLQLTPSSHFTRSAVRPDTDANEPYRWTLAHLTGPTTIHLEGTFSGAISTVPEQLLAELSYANAAGANPVVVASVTETTTVSDAPVAGQLTINGSSEQTVVAPGDVLAMSLNLKNSGQAALKNVRARLLLEASSFQKKTYLQWNKLEDTHDGAVTAEQIDESHRRSTITWTGDQVSDLKNVAPGDNVQLDLRLPLKASTETAYAQFPTGTMRAVLEVQYDGVGGVPAVVRSNTVEISLRTDVAVETRSETAADGSYALSWVLSNSLHDLKNITLTADVYGDVVWKDEQQNVPAGKVVFDPVKKQVIWTIPSMPSSVDVLALQFDLALASKNPTQTMLMSKVKLQATDAVTGGGITAQGEETLLN